ncbi:hypothetical protein [Streptomyces sp. AHA2]|uniref:hypothetical protein n=1 Tax=Streptomyces sp. AHA2 TaxID=3064526 RepID=UPI002FE2CF5A
MSEETVPQQGGAQPKGLLQQMEELMAALNADLSALDADLQSAGEAARATEEERAGQTGRPGAGPAALPSGAARRRERADRELR